MKIPTNRRNRKKKIEIEIEIEWRQKKKKVGKELIKTHIRTESLFLKQQKEEREREQRTGREERVRYRKIEQTWRKQ